MGCQALLQGIPPLPLSPALQVDSLPTATWEALQNIILREISHNIQCIQRNSVLRAHPFVFKSNKVSLAQLAIYHCFIPCFWTSWAWNKDTALLYSIQHCKVPRSTATSRAFDSVCQMHEWLIPYMIGLANPPSHLWNFSTWSFFCREPLTVQILCASTYRWRLGYRHTLFYCSLLHFFFFFLQTEGLWPPCTQQVYWYHFSNSICLLHVSGSHSCNSPTISDFFIIIIFVLMICHQWSVILLL